jgi:hypothetical protein
MGGENWEGDEPVAEAYRCLLPSLAYSLAKQGRSKPHPAAEEEGCF